MKRRLDYVALLVIVFTATMAMGSGCTGTEIRKNYTCRCGITVNIGVCQGTFGQCSTITFIDCGDSCSVGTTATGCWNQGRILHKDGTVLVAECGNTASRMKKIRSGSKLN